MKKSIKKLSFLLISVILALLISVNIIPKTNFTASATAASAENTVDLGNNGQITKDGLENLFKRISGQNTYSSVKQAVSQSILTFNGSEVLSPFSMYALNSASFRKLNNDNNTSVKLGGLTWNLVFVTETINGDLVATLHLADDIGISSQWNKWFSTVDNKRISSQIYGESFIRSTLTGSSYIEKANSSNFVTGKINDTWKNFIDDYLNFITCPREIEYQASKGTYGFTNETYGPNIGGANFSSYIYYGDWANDKLWLPGACEIGHIAARGNVWGLDAQQFGGAAFWTRSGGINLGIMHTGYRTGYSETTQSHSVRPAFHLNLRTAAQFTGTGSNVTVQTPAWAEVSSQPKGASINGDIITAKATGNKMSFKLNMDSQYINVTPGNLQVSGDTIVAKEVGFYGITFGLTGLYDSWTDGTDTNKTLYINIEPAPEPEEPRRADHIVAEWKPDGFGCTTENVIGDLKEHLTVRVIDQYGDGYGGNNGEVTDFELVGSLRVGENSIAVVYKSASTSFMTTVRITVTQANVAPYVSGISVVPQLEEGQDKLTIEATADVNSLKTKLTVTEIMNTGASGSEVTEYKIVGALIPETATLAITYEKDGVTYISTLEVEVTGEVPPDITGNLATITATLNLGDKVITTANKTNDLKQYLTVTGKTYGGGIWDGDIRNYELVGNLVLGESLISVVYQREGVTYITSFSVDVQAEPAITDLEVIVDTSAPFYDNGTLDEIKDKLSVTVKYTDNTSRQLGKEDYELVGAVVVGNPSLAVVYNGQVKAFGITVIKTETPTLTGITASYAQGETVVYTTDSLEVLKPNVTLTAVYSNGTSGIIDRNDYMLIGSLTAGKANIGAVYMGRIATFTVTVTQAAASGTELKELEAVFTQPATPIYANVNIETLKDYLIVKATIGDNAAITLNRDAYQIIGNLTVGVSQMGVVYKGRTAVFGVTVTATPVSPKEVVWQNTGFEYDNKEHAPTAYYVNDNNERVMLTVKGGASEAGTHTATVDESEAGVPLTGSKSVQYTITRRVINIIWSSEASWDYNGEAHAPVASVSTDFDDGRIEIVYILTAKEGSVLTDGKAIEAGEYVAKVTLNNADNYEIRGEREITFKITAVAPVTPENPSTGINWTIILLIGVIAAVLIAMIAVIVALAKGRKQVINVPRSDAGGFYDDYDGDDE